MLKSSLLNYHTSLRNSLRSNLATWWTVLIAVPVSVFFLLVLFESQIAAFIMYLVPPSHRQGIVFYIDIVYLVRTEVLWLGFFFLMTFFLVAHVSKATLDNLVHFSLRDKALYYMLLIISVFFAITLLITTRVFEAFPNSSDEYAYLFQAEMFSRGKLWERAHDLPDFFFHNNIAQYEGILVSRFPPGWPLILSISFELGLDPAYVNPLLGVITLVVFYFFVRRYYSEIVAMWSLVVLAFTAMYFFNAASYFSHVSCLLAVLLFVFNIFLYQEKNRVIYGLLAGFFLGLVIIIRYYTAVLIFLPFLAYLFMHYRMKVITLFIWIGIGCIPCMVYLLWYNYAITGNALTPVTMWAYPSEQLGFVKGHDFLQGVEHVVRRILMFIYWCSPGLLILYGIFLWNKIKAPATRFLHPEDYAFLSLVIGYFFYYQIGGNQYGPRFWFEGLPFLVVFVVNKVLQVRHQWASALLVVSVVYAILKFPFIAYREEMIIDQRQDIYDLVRDEKIRNAVVFVASPTGTIRPMPADDLTRNDPMFMNDVIYALPLRGIEKKLMEYYDDRSFYRYVRDVNNTQGELIKIR